MLLGVSLLLLCGCLPKNPPKESVDSRPEAPVQERLVRSAADAVTALRAESRYPGFAAALDRAEGVLIFPKYVRLGWILSVGGGSGVLLARDDFGKWSPPAFYHMGKGGYGFQAGVEGGSLVYLFFDRDYMLSGLDSGFDMGLDADVVALTTVDRTGVSRLATDRPVLLYVDMGGMYAGVSFSGGFVRPDAAANEAYYGTGNIAPRDVVLRWKHWRGDAAPLWEALGDGGQWDEAVSGQAAP
ncbi:lipid-binding SYLF domain-containing protein [Paucidesulfovibrio longus]|uniref:lipid-binding SYLF domain-containing protein n=1 Tax=Paucidesulfovibrio longus TaxID=889 RepID=UPI0003B6FCB0|nr:lipid-binding SYLF domain-containing protein [Paucidesulfovibrio longus]